MRAKTMLRLGVLISFVALSVVTVMLWAKHNRGSSNEWSVKTQYNGVRGTTNRMITRRADGYETLDIPQAPTFMLFCPDDRSPYVVIDTGEPLWGRSADYYITYRFDGASATEELWNASENKALYPEDAFARQAIERSGVWLELPYGQHSKRPVHFTLSGLAQIYNQNCPHTSVQ